jgi:5-methylcytosine-specific restriction endonuclease McrA
MEFKLESFHRNVPDDDLIADLQRVAEGEGISSREYDKKGKFTPSIFMNRFGSWNNALTTAGLSPVFIRNASEEELFENLEEVWNKLGRQPKFRDMSIPLSRFGARAYLARFGGWRKALEKFVESANTQFPSIVDNEDNNERAELHQNEQPSFKHKTKREINWRLRWHVLNRDNFRCASCGLSPAIAPGTVLHVDHIKPWSKGGETVLENLQTKCGTCNLGKGNTE